MSQKYTRALIVTLVVTNIITAGLFAGAIIKAGKQNDTQPAVQQNIITEYSYKDNPKYIEEMSHYSVYRKHADIVMLGNSITERADWSELLNRNDIVNRGIGSDITEGYLNRMESIYSVSPKICFIMGGVNDIAKNISLESTVSNIAQICKELNVHQIIPVLQSVLYVANTYPEYEKMNMSIFRMNLEFERVASENNIRFVDLNQHLASEKELIAEYVLSDGIHLNGAGYAKWRTVLSGIIAGYGL